MKTCNLLPWKVQRQQLLASRLHQWLAATAACLMITLVWFTLAWQRRAAEQRDVDELIRQSRFVTYLSEQVDGLRKQNRTLAYREALFKKLQQQVQPLSVLGVVGQSAAACEGVTVDRVESAEQTGASHKPAVGKETATNLISIRVEAASSLPVAQLVLALRERQTFRKVELKAASDRSAGGQTSESYVIECSF
jgi:hypothetical protein